VSATVVEAAPTMLLTPVAQSPLATHVSGRLGIWPLDEGPTVPSVARSCRSMLPSKEVPPHPLPEESKFLGESSVPIDSSRESRLRKESEVSTYG
jgi:hypothetical protein